MLGSGPGARSPHQIWPPEPDAETAPRRPDLAQDRASTAGSRDLAAWVFERACAMHHRWAASSSSRAAAGRGPKETSNVLVLLNSH
eukprot:COSAG01_NODE_3397_length_6144_cov_33.015550_11_plen_86_part_00